MNVSEAIVRMLKAYGVEYLFGVPGDTSMPFYEALYDAVQGDDSLKHVMARDERSAAFMADAYARVSNRPAVCEGPSGGGATYFVGGLAEPHGSAVPVICLVSDTPLKSEHRGVLTAVDQVGLFQPITKWTTLAKTPDRIPALLRRAFRVATSGRAGAVHVALPEDLLSQPLSAAAAEDIWAEAACMVFPSFRARPDAEAVEAAVNALVAASRPVIVAGGGALLSQAQAELQQLAEALSLPVATTLTGKGCFPEHHRLSLGVIGGNGARDWANDALDAADLVFFVGCKTGSVTTVGWTLPRPGRAQVLHLDVDPVEIGNNYRTPIGLWADAKLGLADLVLAARRHLSQNGKTLRAAAWAEELAKQSAAWWRDAERDLGSDATPVHPARLMRELERALPEDAIVVADPGTPTPNFAAYYRLRCTGRHWVVPRAHGGLGYAIPGVVGAKLAAPDRVVVGMMGDGSFGMSAGELETLNRLRLPVTLIQCNNRSFGWMKAHARLFHGGKYLSMDFSDIDSAKIAAGFGLRGVRVERPEQLGPALREAVAGRVPTFIDVATISEEVELPPVATWTRRPAGAQH